MNSDNSRSSKPHVLMFKFTDKLDLDKLELEVKKVMFYEILVFTDIKNIYIYRYKNIKSLHNNNKFKTSAPIWNDEFELPDR